MSETKSQTPETDAEIERRLRLRYHETPEKIPHVEASFARSLEISRDQWKAVAERLAEAVVETDPRYVELFEEAGLGNATKDSIAVKLMREALSAYNQLNSTTENK